MAIRKRFRTRAHPMGEVYLNGRKIRVIDTRTIGTREEYLVPGRGRSQEWLPAGLFARTAAQSRKVWRRMEEIREQARFTRPPVPDVDPLEGKARLARRKAQPFKVDPLEPPQ